MIGTRGRMAKPGMALALLGIVLTACTGVAPPSAGQPSPFAAPDGPPGETFAPPDFEQPSQFVPTDPFVPTETFMPPDFQQPDPFVPPDFQEPPVVAPDPGFGAPGDGGRQPVLFTQQAIFDPMAGNVAAMTFLLPNGWQADGSVQWTPEWRRVAQLWTRVTDPATGITIEWLPLQDFLWFQAPAGFDAPIGGNYQGKAYVPPITDPTQFVAQMWMPTVLSHLQGAPVVGIQEVPVVAEAFKQGYGGPAEAFAYRLRYEFQQNGTVWEEDVFLALLYAGSADFTSWFVNFAYTVRAPKGEIDRNIGLISTIIASRITTPEWEGTYRLVQQLFVQGIQQQMADTAAFGQLLTQYRAESQALQQQVTQERLASQDRIAQLRQESLGGVETFADPFSQGLVQLPVGWNEYWVSPQGEFLTTDTPGFDPNQFDNRGWQRLQRRTF